MWIWKSQPKLYFNSLTLLSHSLKYFPCFLNTFKCFFSVSILIKYRLINMGRKSAFCFQLWEGTLVLLLMEIVCVENTVQLSSQNKLSMLLHFRIGKHSPSCLGKERSVESQLFCCLHFAFAVTTFHQQISYRFGISSVQHKEHRIFFPFAFLESQESSWNWWTKRETQADYFIDCFQVSGQSKWHLLKACCHCAALRGSLCTGTLNILWSPYLAFIEFCIIFC